jgi:aryl-alcohol dehydrogenase-like predicted oxidoreductase
MVVSRREFIGALAAGSAMAAQSKSLPTRVLGRTQVRVTILAHGCGSRFTAYKTDEEAIAALNHAIDLGVRYVDTAQGYGNGSSERRVGMVMKTRRKEVFLSTKTAARKADDVMRAFEQSLKRLQTDYVDLLHIHSLSGDDDLTAIEAKDGALSALHKLRDQKATRFIGITSHMYPSTLAKALERHDFDVTQMALNAALIGMKDGGAAGMVPNPAVKESFESIALPVANRKKMGVIAMKVFAQDKLKGQVPPEKLLGYALSLPVTAAVLGWPEPHFIDSSVEIARNFRPMPPEEMKTLADRLSALNKEAHDLFFVNHIDA